MVSPLTATSPLSAFTLKAPDAECKEQTGVAIISVSMAKSGARKLATAFKNLYGVALPKPGQYVMIKDGMILSSARDQFFVCQKATPETLLKTLTKQCSGAASMTDQSDAWAQIILSGAACPAIMERLCHIDTSVAAFPIGSVARTSIEHMGAIIARIKPAARQNDAFLILTPRSSAGDMAHALAHTPPFFS
ncbi:MAG: hypothetical protein VXX58_05340 [Pseudomonadota bacterium]|nr:hypothetical protein [Pseudomonadota bacterium]